MGSVRSASRERPARIFTHINFILNAESKPIIGTGKRCGSVDKCGNEKPKSDRGETAA